MAQLSNDCFAAGERPLRLEEALAFVEGRLGCVVGEDVVALAAAQGRILASDVLAPISLPPFDNSAVDGYAVRFADLAAEVETRLPIVGRVAAGGRAEEAVPETATRIFTGAPMPAECDTVFMQEDVRLEGGAAVLPAGLKWGANRRLAGEDLARGSLALPAGRRLGPAELGLLGALGQESVPVRRPLSVALFSTGDELARPDIPADAPRLNDANRPMLAALLRQAGAVPADAGILPDMPAPVRDAIARAAAGHDLVLTSGGVSMGEEDHVRDALASLGTLTFWRLGIKPGRPVAMAVVDGTPVIGLPGNPVAAFVTFAFVVRPILARLAGETFRRPLPLAASAGFAYRKKAGRREFVRVRLEREGGRVVAIRHPAEGAGIITSLTETDGLVDLEEDVVAVTPGDPIAFWPYPVLL